MEERRIEIAPLAFMRGRTLSNAFVLLDEAQNATEMQMKMFLTRLGEGSRMVITGDRSQVDLPRGVQSGLRAAERILDGVEGIRFSYFTSSDVVRHPLVARIIRAYERDEEVRWLTLSTSCTRAGLGHACACTLWPSAPHGTLRITACPRMVTKSPFWPATTPASRRSMPVSRQGTADQRAQLASRWSLSPETGHASRPAPRPETRRPRNLGDIALAFETCSREALRRTNPRCASDPSCCSFGVTSSGL